MKANPLACALLVLLAVAVQLPAQQPTTNAAGANAAPKKQTAKEFLDAPNAAGTNKGYVILEPAKQSKPAASKWQPPEGDEIIKGTKISRWDDTTPLPAKTPTTANNSKKLNSKPRANEFGFVPDTETKPVIQEFPDNAAPQETKPADRLVGKGTKTPKTLSLEEADRLAETSTPAKRSVYDFLRDAAKLVDWGLVASCVTITVLIAISVLILFRVFRQVFRYARWMKASMSKHNPQRIVLGLGLLLVILNGLFPPFERTGWGYYLEGYRFLFAPPEHSKIIFTRFLVQFVTIIAATAGAFFLFGMRDKKGVAQGKIQEAANQPVETILKDECRDIPPPEKPVTENVQAAAPGRELTPPNNETLPVHEPQTEQKQADLQNTTIAVDVFFDLQESLNLNPSREQWEHEFLTRINPQQPIRPDIMDALWENADATGRKPAPKNDVERAEPPTANAQTPRHLNWVSAGLLVFCLVMVILGLWGASFNEKAVEKLTEGIIRILFCAGILAWMVRKAGKGYALFTFSLVCACCVVIGAYYFQIAKHTAKERNKQWAESTLEVYSNTLEFVQRGGTGNVPEVKLTGNPVNDAISQMMQGLMSSMAKMFGRMNDGIDSLGKRDVFDDSVLENRQILRQEIKKRSDALEILEKFRGGIALIKEECKSKVGAPGLTEEEKQGIIRGFESSFQKLSPKYDAVLDARETVETAERDFMQFLIGAFDDYRLKDGKIVFGSDTNVTKYKSLSKGVSNANNELEALAKRFLSEGEAAKSKIRALGGIDSANK